MRFRVEKIIFYSDAYDKVGALTRRLSDNSVPGDPIDFVTGDSIRRLFKYLFHFLYLFKVRRIQK